MPSRLRTQKDPEADDAKHWEEQYLLLRAEFENYRKRLTKKSEDDLKFASQKLVVDLLDSLDALEAGILNASAFPRDAVGQLVDGFAMVHQQLITTLAEHNVHQIPAAPGAPFNPEQHEAIGQEPGTANTIVRVNQNGYVMHNRVVRTAKVTIGGSP